MDINLPGQRRCFAGESTGHASAAAAAGHHGKREPRTDAFRLETVDYLLKPLDPEQIAEAVNRLLAHLRPFPSRPTPPSARHGDSVATPDKILFTGSAATCTQFKDVDRDQIRLLARNEFVAVLRRDRRTWIPQRVREEFATLLSFG